MELLSTYTSSTFGDFSSIAVHLLGITTIAYTVLKYIQAKRSPLNALPTIGYSGILTSYITAIQWMTKGKDLVKEGCDKYPGRAFKVASMSKWVVVLNGPQLVEDVRKAPEDILSFDAAIAEQTQAEFTFGPGLDTHPHHVTAIRNQITRNIMAGYDDIRDEIIECFKDYIPLCEDWVSVPGYATFLRIICRSTNRFLVGLPLCREVGYLTAVEQLTIDVMMSSRIINLFPSLLKPVVGRCLKRVAKRLEQGCRHLTPLVEERLARYKVNPDDQPNDIIRWLTETATHDYHLTVQDMAMRIMVVNLTAIHTTTMALTQAIYDLAVRPEYVKELREEVENVIAENGWTRLAIQKLRKVDSFLKESHRLNGGTSWVMTRKTLKDWTLSSGTTLPAGTYIGIAADAMSKSEALFQDAESFKGFRFAEMRDGDDEWDPIKHQYVCLHNDHIIFGHGRHACPGRFFAANGMKSIFAHILVNYDVQLENGTLERPPNIYFETSTVPNQEAKVYFRKRSSA